ncbi:cholecystokinin receptor type A-like [Haliotis rubra]|uniref:cholecystokinin receptor type A-like n=1 Tax=Haliotis rubra TaxID=36100 RepID=UPI001EE58DBE|nr:cholecystokinin receptor type A-like [Haliotis rubra]
MEAIACNETLSPVMTGYPVRPVETIMGLLAFFSLLGTTGNAVVLYVYTRKRNKLPSTIFIISLAGTDLSVCIIVMPYTMTVEYLDYEIKYDLLCKLYLFLITSNVPFSAFIMVAIAVDRYICICHPHWHVLDTRRAKLILFSLIVFSMILGIITALAYGVYQYKSKIDDAQIIDRNFTSVTSINWTIAEDADVCLNKTQHANCTDKFEYMVNCTTDVLLYRFVDYSGVCKPNQLIFTTKFRKTYQKVYAGMFLVAFIVVFVLYILIYKSVLERRSKKMRQRRKTQLSLYRETSMTDTHLTMANGSSRSSVKRSESRRTMLDKDGCIKEKYWLANIRTALMLFVVTLAFIMAFLPSWLMAHRVVTFNPIVFYLYFAYNVSNPIIYAFMNPAFRRELKDLISCMRCTDI